LTFEATFSKKSQTSRFVIWEFERIIFHLDAGGSCLRAFFWVSSNPRVVWKRVSQIIFVTQEGKGGKADHEFLELPLHLRLGWHGEIGNRLIRAREHRRWGRRPAIGILSCQTLSRRPGR